MLPKRIFTMSFKQQLFMALALLSLVPLFAVSYFAQEVMLKASVRVITQNAHQDIRNGAERVDDYFGNIEHSLNELVIDPNFQKLIGAGVDPSQAATQSIYLNFVKDRVQKFMQSRSDITAVLLADRSGYGLHLSKDLSAFDYSFRFTENPLYKHIFDTSQRELFGPHIAPYYVAASSRSVVSLVTPVTNFIDYKVGAWIIVELKTSSVEQMVGQMTTNQTGSLFLFNPTNGDSVGLSVMPEGTEHSLTRLISASGAREGTGKLDLDRRKYEIAFHTLKFEHWTIVSITPLDLLMKGVYITRETTLGIAFVSFLLALLFIAAFLKQLLDPLYSLKQGMAAFSRGITQHVQSKSKNELGFLINTFNHMLDDRQQLELELRETVVREKEKELLQLQAQINPHFLFNTLGTIQSLAQQGKTPVLEEAIYSVSQMLRYNSRNDRGWATLQEEIGYIRHFHSIHAFRHELEADIVYTISDDCRLVPIIKLSLQPFLENALKYGWNARCDAQRFRAEIAASRSDNGRRLIVRISDNGPGFSPEALGALQSLIHPETSDDDPFFTHHIGISNVYRRLRLVYGNACDLELSNRSDGGAEVLLSFPAGTDHSDVLPR